MGSLRASAPTWLVSAHVARVMKDESEIDKQRNKARDTGDGKGGKKKDHV